MIGSERVEDQWVNQDLMGSKEKGEMKWK